jgi:hypothetical protein
MPTTTPRSFPRGGGATTPRRTPTRSTARPATTGRSFGRSTAPTPRSRPSIRRKPQPQSKGQQVLKALTSAVPSGKAASKAKSAAGKPPKGLLVLGAAGGLAAALKKRQSNKTQTVETVAVTEPVPAPSVTSVPEPSPVEVRADGTL